MDQILSGQAFFRIVDIAERFSCCKGQPVFQPVFISVSYFLQDLSIQGNTGLVSIRIISIAISDAISCDRFDLILFVDVLKHIIFSICILLYTDQLICIFVIIISGRISFRIRNQSQQTILFIIGIGIAVTSSIRDLFDLSSIGSIFHRRFHAVTVAFQNPPFMGRCAGMIRKYQLCSRCIGLSFYRQFFFSCFTDYKISGSFSFFDLRKTKQLVCRTCCIFLEDQGVCGSGSCQNHSRCVKRLHRIILLFSLFESEHLICFTVLIILVYPVAFHRSIIMNIYILTGMAHSYTYYQPVCRGI